MILKLGAHGPNVEHLQRQLKSAGYFPGSITGAYDKSTSDAVFAFQVDRPDLDDDHVAGPMTLGALEAATILEKPDPPDRPHTAVPCEATTWAAFQHLVADVTAHVHYGPGRGLWADGSFLVTYAPGRKSAPGDLKLWPNAKGALYPSFHCTSWINFFLGWLLRRNADYTHAGNVPSMFDLLEKSPDLHQIPGGGAYRGYGDACALITPDGSGAARAKVAKVLDLKEILARRATLPTFVPCAQSDRRADGTYNWWHHVVLFVVDHHDNDRLYRIAADGYKGTHGYSGDPMRWVEITDKNVGQYASAIYRAYGVNTVDGTYGDQSRPIANVAFEP